MRRMQVIEREEGTGKREQGREKREEGRKVKCPACRKELYDNGEGRFNCPFCGAEVVGERFAAQEETLEMRCQRLERELARQRVKAEIEEQSAFEHFWFSGANPFSMLERQSARNALDRGDIASAKKHLASAEKSFNIGCMLYIALFVAILIVVACSR